MAERVNPIPEKIQSAFSILLYVSLVILNMRAAVMPNISVWARFIFSSPFRTRLVAS